MPLPSTTVPTEGLDDFTLTLDVQLSENTDGNLATLDLGHLAPSSGVLLSARGNGALHGPAAQPADVESAALLQPRRWQRVVLSARGDSAEVYIDGFLASASRGDANAKVLWRLSQPATLVLCAPAPATLLLRYVRLRPGSLTATQVEAELSVDWHVRANPIIIRRCHRSEPHVSAARAFAA
jgi:hypothetical protein